MQNKVYFQVKTPGQRWFGSRSERWTVSELKVTIMVLERSEGWPAR